MAIEGATPIMPIVQAAGTVVTESATPIGSSLAPVLNEASFVFNPSIGGEIFPSTISATKLSFPEFSNLFALPKHVVDSQHIGVDRICPSPLTAIHSGLFETIKPIPKINIPEILDSTQLISYEERGDDQTLYGAIEKAKQQGFDESTEQEWIQKAQTAIKKKVIPAPIAAPSESIVNPILQPEPQPVPHPAVIKETLPSPSVQTEPFTQPQPAPFGSEAPPRVPTAISTIFNEPEESPSDKDDPYWDVFELKSKKNIAERSLKRRLSVARDIVNEAQNNTDTNTTLDKKVSDNLYKLDVPDVDETISIMQKKLNYPSVAPNAELDLIKVENRQNPSQILNQVNRAIRAKPPVKQDERSQYKQTVKQQLLPEIPKVYAQQGAEHIALTKKDKWEPRKSRVINRDPINLEKEKQAA